MALLGGAAIGAVFGEVLSQLTAAIQNVRTNDDMFKSTLESLQSTLNSLTPLMVDEEEFNRKLGLREDKTKKLIEQMKEGKILIRKCLKIHWLTYDKSKYTRKLVELDHSILKFIQVDLQVQMARQQSEIFQVMNDIRKHLSVVPRNGAGGWSCSVPECPVGVVGMDVALKELKMELFKDEVSVLLLTAPGGCGKTTLVKMLGHDEEVKDKFGDNIFFLTVSKTPNPKAIVQGLFDHKSCKAPEFQSDEHAINQLGKLLNQIKANPILLILDDVWSNSDSLLKKFEFHIPNYKILVTSRSEFPRFQSRYKLKPLNDKEAMELFRHSANLQHENSSIPDDLVRKIARFCGGLPLALEVIGRSLYNEPVQAWKCKEKKWSNGRSILDSDNDILLCLESSLDFLDDVNKKCFMDLGSFREDQRIPVAALIDMWVELYKLDENDIVTNLRELTKCHLASLVVTRKVSSEADSYYNEDFIIQHDLIRELAIHQSCQNLVELREKLIVDIIGNNFPEWWTEQEQRTINARLLSISTDEKFSSNWFNMQPLEVEVLVLNFQTKNYTLPEFVEKMGKLKVLIATNNGFFPAELSNFQLLGFLHNLKRIRLENVSVPSLCNNPISLSSLEKISLVMCSIGQAFRNCTIKISDAFPNLMEINIDYCKDLVELPDGLCEIVPLKNLNITNCHKLSALPEGIGKLVNLEVLMLRSCTDLSVLPESIRCLHKLRYLDISDCSSLSKLPKHIGELCNLEVLQMNGCSGLSYELPESTLELEQLVVVICDEEGATLWNDDIKDCLTNLTVEITENDINLNWLANMDL